MLQDYIGFGSLEEALTALESGGAYRRVFVVASKTGWERFNPGGLRQFFKDRACEVFSDFTNNPEFAEMLEGEKRYRNFKPDLIFTVGGGSALDVAKVVKALAHTKQPCDPDKPESLELSGDGPPLVAVATTAGSGSEATQYAVFYLNSIKQSLAHPSLRPEVAVVDPQMTYSLPPGETAATGLDAISQAVEAYWASWSTPEAKTFAKAAIRYAMPNIATAVQAPDPGSRYNMAQSAYLAGKAINITRTTMPHALAYHLTKRYGIPHGHACAVSLAFFFRINMDPSLEVITPAGRDGHQRTMNELAAIMHMDKPESGFRIMRGLMRSLGLKATLAEIGLTARDQVREWIKSVNTVRARNHPVAVTADYLENFFLEHDPE